MDDGCMFNLEEVYVQGDSAIFDGYRWTFQGMPRRYTYQEPSHVRFSFMQTQVETIGAYPAETLGWERRERMPEDG